MARPLRIALQKYRRVKISGGVVSRCLPGEPEGQDLRGR